jgi:glucose-6-phosphate isomerase
MSVPAQRIAAGRLESAWRDALARLAEAEAIARMWARRGELWRDEPHHLESIANRLGWISVLDPMRAEASRLAAYAAAVRAAGIRDVVLLGMGGSSLAPEVFSLLFPPAEGRFFILDSTDPAAVRAVERAVVLRTTLFIVASKSGTTVETLSQFHYFRHLARAAALDSPCGNFVAITDAGSYLDQIAGEYGFRDIFRNPADIGGRFSALSYFGLVPAALAGAPLVAILDAAIEMRRSCSPESPAETNPGLALGALLGAAAANGAEKLALVATPRMAPLGNWIEQLVAESTGKDGKGIVPIAGARPAPAARFADATVALLSLEGEDRSELDAFAAELAAAGVPLADIRLGEPAELGAEFFRWEVATAMAGALLGVNPFDEPNVKESKDITARILGQKGTGALRGPAPDSADDGVEIHLGGRARQLRAERNLSDTLASLSKIRQPGDYLAVLAFLPRTAEHEAALERLRAELGRRFGLHVLTGFGPRYLHSIGQLYKGGPPAGIFLLLTARPRERLLIPEAGYCFADLELAQALGDFEALARREKPVVRLHLARGAAEGLAAVERALGIEN